MAVAAFPIQRKTNDELSPAFVARQIIQLVLPRYAYYDLDDEHLVDRALDPDAAWNLSMRSCSLMIAPTP